MHYSTMKPHKAIHGRFEPHSYGGTYIDVAVELEKIRDHLYEGSGLLNSRTGSGLALLLLAVPFLLGLERLQIGTLENIGPGLLPGVILAFLILIATGLLLTGILPIEPTVNQENHTPRKSNGHGLQIDRQGLRGILAIGAGIFAFTFLLPAFGLLIAVTTTSFVCSIARPPFKPIASIILALFNAATVWLIFIYALDLPFQAFSGNWPWTS